MNKIYYPESRRGKASMGWLNARYYFSFGNFFYDRERMNFGVLRVLNDDIIAPGMGFGEHPHDNMEIITIPLSGALQHKDNMGNTSIIRKGDIQVMSAGSGVYHSEFNPSKQEETKLFQIWLFPDKKNVLPRYEQLTYDPILKPNQWTQILSPNVDDDGVWIHQRAWFNLGDFTADTLINYNFNDSSNGAYIIVINGEATVGGQPMKTRDALGVWSTDKLSMNISAGSRLLVLEVPMDLDKAVT